MSGKRWRHPRKTRYVPGKVDVLEVVSDYLDNLKLFGEAITDRTSSTQDLERILLATFHPITNRPFAREFVRKLGNYPIPDLIDHLVKMVQEKNLLDGQDIVTLKQINSFIKYTGG